MNYNDETQDQNASILQPFLDRIRQSRPGLLLQKLQYNRDGLGDPAVDFATIINALGESFLWRMAQYYPGIVPALDRARFMASTLELQWVLGGLRTKDLSWFLVHIGRARDVMPYGVFDG
jgi:aminoglycoside 2''-phosphotransferase